MKYDMESPWMKLGGKISKKRTRIIWAENAYGTKFTQLRGKRSSIPTASEIAAKAKFKTAAEQTLAIMQDIDQLQPYRNEWIAKVRSGSAKHKTLRGYIFAKVYNTL